MKTPSKRSVLFFLGLLIGIAAFFGDHIEDVPFLDKLIDPTHCGAQTGLATLIQNKKLDKSDEGYKEIRGHILNFYLQNVSPKNRKLLPKDFSDRIDVRIYLSDGTAEFGGEKVGRAVCFQISPEESQLQLPPMENNNRAPLLTDFKEEIANSKDSNVFVFCLVLFAVSILIEIAAFCMESGEQTDSGHKS